jgi:ADP-heptose:LPS heptosyltransferase
MLRKNQMKRMILNRGSGVGDCLMGLPICAGLSRKYPTDTIFYGCNPKTAHWTGCFNFGDNVSVVDWNEHYNDCVVHAINESYTLEMIARGTGRTRMEYYCQIADNVVPIMPTLKTLPAPRISKAVVICPHSVYGNREWQTPHYMELIALLKHAGEKPVVISDVAHRCHVFECETFVGLNPAEVFSLVSAAKCVISSDTAGGHFGGICNVPTVVLGGPTKIDKVFWWRSVIGINHDMSCNGCYFQGKTYESEGGQICTGLQTIRASQVFETCKEFL